MATKGRSQLDEGSKAAMKKLWLVVLAVLSLVSLAGCIIYESDEYEPPHGYYRPYPYGQGVERGRYERYDQGRRHGYEDGYYDSRTGWAY